MAPPAKIDLSMKTLTSNRGTALLEAAISLTVGMSVVTVLLVFSYTAVAKVWLDHITYEATICLAEDQSKLVCRQELTQRAQWIQARIQNSSWLKSSQVWQVKVKWKLLRDISLSTQNRIDLASLKDRR